MKTVFGCCLCLIQGPERSPHCVGWMGENGVLRRGEGQTWSQNIKTFPQIYKGYFFSAHFFLMRQDVPQNDVKLLLLPSPLQELQSCTTSSWIQVSNPGFSHARQALC